jgi:hypothetical protein
MHRKERGAVRQWVSSVFLIALFAAALAPQPARAEYVEYYEEMGLADSGPGTRFLQCRAESWANYNTCLVKSSKESEMLACYLAWDLDNIGCDIELAASLLLGSLLKLVF